MRITIPVSWVLLKNWVNMCKLYVCVLSSHSVVSDSLQPMDGSPPGSSVHGILQARKLKWVAISSSRRSSWPRDRIHVSCIGRWVLYCWATREARILYHCAIMMSPGQLRKKKKSRDFVLKWKIISISKIYCKLTATFKAGVLWNILKFWFCHINQIINSWGSRMKLWALQKVKRRHLCRKRDNKKAMGAEPYRMSKWETEKAREETAIHRGISQCVCMCVWETATERDRDRERRGRRETQPWVGYPVKASTAFIALHVAVLCLVAQSCMTLCHSMDCSPPGSSVQGLLQARILEWVAMPSSRGSSQSRDQTQVSHIAGRFFTIWTTREDSKGFTTLGGRAVLEAKLKGLLTLLNPLKLSNRSQNLFFPQYYTENVNSQSWAQNQCSINAHPKNVSSQGWAYSQCSINAHSVLNKWPEKGQNASAFCDHTPQHGQHVHSQPISLPRPLGRENINMFHPNQIWIISLETFP